MSDLAELSRIKRQFTNAGCCQFCALEIAILVCEKQPMPVDNVGCLWKNQQTQCRYKAIQSIQREVINGPESDDGW